MPQDSPRPRRPFRFYKTSDGKQLAKAELLALGIDARAAVVEVMNRKECEECFPHEDRGITDSPLRELRITLDGNEYRVLYAAVAPHHEVLLAVCIATKKGDKLPKSTLKLAERRLADWLERGEEQAVRRSKTGAPSARERQRSKSRKKR